MEIAMNVEAPSMKEHKARLVGCVSSSFTQWQVHKTTLQPSFLRQSKVMLPRQSLPVTTVTLGAALTRTWWATMVACEGLARASTRHFSQGSAGGTHKGFVVSRRMSLSHKDLLCIMLGLSGVPHSPPNLGQGGIGWLSGKQGYWCINVSDV